MVDGDAVHVFAQQLGGGLLLFHSLDSSFSPPSESLSDATTLAPRIVICTVDATEESVFFKIRPTAKLEKLMNAYCEFKDKDLCTLRFLFNGKCFNADDTAHGVSWFLLSNQWLFPEPVVLDINAFCINCSWGWRPATSLKF